MRQIVLDTETTGLETEHGHRIIEVGCVELINRRLTGKTFHHYFNPERDIDEGALKVHGISSEFLQNKPVFAAIAPEFLQFLNGDELIIHNAAFDVGFINAELARLSFKTKIITDYCHVVDTLQMARQMHIGQRNSLDALCKRYGVDNSRRDLHGALLDAHLLAQVYLAMTGGQATLFADSDAADTAQQTQRQQTEVTRRSVSSLPVILATDDEISQHEHYLENMRKKGTCLWQ